jgi:hypothetical protein
LRHFFFDVQVKRINQILFGGEIVKQRSIGYARLLGDFCRRDSKAVSGEKFERRLQDMVWFTVQGNKLA